MQGLPPTPIDLVLARGPVIPVVTVDDPAIAVRIAEALLSGGISVIEITLRTPRALAAIAAVAAAFPAMAVGAGTVLGPRDFAHAVDSGASFVVSPGATRGLLDFAAGTGVPYLPGVATISEAMNAMASGFSRLKLFPASSVGGPAMAAALGSVLPDVVLCPTGGIGFVDAPSWLACKTVRCVGGSWLTPSAAVVAGDFATITRLAREAAALRPA